MSNLLSRTWSVGKTYADSSVRVLEKTTKIVVKLPVIAEKGIDVTDDVLSVGILELTNQAEKSSAWRQRKEQEFLLKHKKLPYS